jgi:hypothetical protein
MLPLGFVNSEHGQALTRGVTAMGNQAFLRL